MPPVHVHASVHVTLCRAVKAWGMYMVEFHEILNEFKAGPRAQKDPSKAEEIFKKIDSYSSGSVSLEELR